MTQEQIEKGNLAIAKFMGYGQDEFGAITSPLFSNSPLYKVGDLKYHSDWSFLMPVLEKICRLKIGDGEEYVEYATPRTFGMLNPGTGMIMVRLNGMQCFEATTLYEATYNAVVDFIVQHKKN